MSQVQGMFGVGLCATGSFEESTEEHENVAEDSDGGHHPDTEERRGGIVRSTLDWGINQCTLIYHLPRNKGLSRRCLALLIPSPCGSQTRTWEAALHRWKREKYLRNKNKEREYR